MKRIWLALACLVCFGWTASGQNIQNISLTPAPPYCAGQSVSVSFDVTGGSFNPGNSFIVTLSTASGAFNGNSAVLNIGSAVELPANHFTITNVELPASATSGNQYRIRISATSPVATGTMLVANNFTINAKPVITGPAAVCQGISTSFTATGTPNAVNAWAVVPGTGTGAVTNLGLVAGVATSAFSGTTAGQVNLVYTDIHSCFASKPITINTFPSATITPAGPTTFCDGGSVQLDANTGAGLSYQWKLNTVNIPGETNASLTRNSPGLYEVQVTRNSCDALSAPVTVTVNPLPVANAGTINAQCFNALGNTFTPIGAAITNGIGTWTVSANPNGLSILISNEHTITPSISITYPGGQTGGNVILKLTTISDQLPACGSDEAFVTLKVIPIPTVSSVSNIEICAGDPIGPITLSSPQDSLGNPVSFTWTNSNPSIGLPASGVGAIIPDSTATNNFGGPIQGIVKAIPTIFVSGVTCPGSQTTINTITVNPTARVVAVSDQTLCHGMTVNAIPFTGTVIGSNLSWTSSGANIGSATSGTSTLPSFVVSNTGTAPITATFEVTPSSPNGCQVESEIFTITALPRPQVNAIPNQLKCNGTQTDSVAFGTVVTGTVVSYEWANSNTNTIGFGNASSGGPTNIFPSFTTNNTSTASVSTTITVTPKITEVPGCPPGTPETFTITSKPSPQVNQPSDQALCNNSTSSQVTFTSPVNASESLIYKWSNNNVLTGLLDTVGTGDINAFTTQNTTNASLVSTITVTPSLVLTNSPLVTCSEGAGSSKQFRIRVKPTAKVNANTVTNKSVCNQEAINTIVFASNIVLDSGDKVQFNWLSTGSIGQPGAGTDQIDGFIASNPGNTPLISTIEVSPQLNATLTSGTALCPVDPNEVKSFTMTARPTPRFSGAVTTTLCSGDSLIYSGTSTVANTGFSWDRLPNASINDGAGSHISGDVIREILSSNFALIPHFATYNVHLDAAGCTSDSSLTATISPVPVTPTFDLPGGFCDNTSFLALKADRLPNPGETFTWTAETPVGTVNDSLLQNQQNALIKFKTGVNLVTLHSEMTGTGCPTPSTSKTVTISSTSRIDPTVIEKNYNADGTPHTVLICLANDVDSFQWGRTSKSTMIEEPFAQEHGQELFFRISSEFRPDLFYYWVKTRFKAAETCLRQAYFNAPFQKPGIHLEPSMQNEVSIQVYPNPAQSSITIKLTGSRLDDIYLEIYDLSGRRMRSLNVYDTKTELPINDLPPGYYLLSCKQNGRKIATTRFIKN